jgi:histidinol-phosphate aminotransferase
VTAQWPSWLPLRSDLQALSPYGAPQVPSQAAMNTNENPFPPSPKLQAAIAAKLAEVSATLNRYPDRDAVLLRGALANFVNELSGTNFSQNQVWAANGSNEILQSVFLAFSGGKALGFTPSYSMHPLIAKVTSVEWIDGARNNDLTFNIDRALIQVKEFKPRLTFITTPNNPTGDAIAIKDILALSKAVASVGGLLIVDEAYAEFSQEVSSVSLIEENPHLIVIRTMSKAFAFAGARVGYLVGDSKIVDAMSLVRLPYHLSALTQGAAVVALDFRKELLSSVTTLISERERVVKALTGLGLSSIPSSANFVLFSGFAQSAPQLWQAMLDRGILIRDVGLSGYLRVTIGNEAENNLFIEALAQIVSQKTGEQL